MFPNVCKKRNQICGNCFCIPTLGLSRYLSPKIKLITTQVSALSIIGDALRVQNKTTHPFTCLQSSQLPLVFLSSSLIKCVNLFKQSWCGSIYKVPKGCDEYYSTLFIIPVIQNISDSIWYTWTDNPKWVCQYGVTDYTLVVRQSYPIIHARSISCKIKGTTCWNY